MKVPETPASNNNNVDPTVTNSVSPTQSVDASSVPGSDLAGLGGMSVAGLTLGAKSVPILASVFAGATAVWDTGAYLLDGDFKKAGVRAASGVADTVLSAGGALSLPFATAAREGIEEGAQLVMGNDVDMPDSPTLQLGKSTVNWVLGR